MNTLVRAVLVVGVLACGAGCGERSESRVVTSAVDDAEMNAAIEEARRTIGSFVRALEDRKAHGTDFSFLVLLRIGDGSVERYWLEDVSHAVGWFYGVLAEQPHESTGLRRGDGWSLKPDQVSDWKYTDYEGRMVGGFTVRVEYARTPEAERARRFGGVRFREPAVGEGE